VNAVEPWKIYKSTIKNGDVVLLKLEFARNANFMGFAIGDVEKTRNLAAILIAGVKFDGAFALTKFGSGKKFQTQFDGRGI
jgi:hypothetical protein